MPRHPIRKAALTRADLVRAVHARIGVPGAQASVLVDQVLGSLRDAVLEPDAEPVKITGFGTFFVRQKGERVGRNPRTLEEVPITERRVLRFRCSNLLREAINEERE
ncbi:MAG: integration host factor subunit alpha [Pseudomonadota bacterium]